MGEQAVENIKQAGRPLSARAVDAMRPGDADRSDTGENIGLRVSCGSTGVRTFFYRYRSPETEKLTQLKLGAYPSSMGNKKAALFPEENSCWVDN
jgi:hypothetical protein